MSTELGASLLSLVLPAGLWLAASGLVSWLGPTPERRQTGDRVELTIGVFVVSFVSFLGVLAVDVALLDVDHAPSPAAQASYGTFFSTAAVVLVGLLIALAIATHERGSKRISAEAPSDVVQTFVLIVLGEILSVLALLPRSPAIVFSTALVTAPASLVSAVVAITLLGFSARESAPTGREPA